MPLFGFTSTELHYGGAVVAAAPPRNFWEVKNVNVKSG